MSVAAMPTRVIVITSLALLCIASGAWFLKYRQQPEVPDQLKKDTHRVLRTRLTNFRDSAEQAGIAFKMVFLTGEQGETFKSNLYDHGCGVVVGDFDGDGYDDIYFLNQLGKNALYRNKQDGTFEDVTAKAGVGLGDRVCVGATFADYDNSGRQSLYVTSTRGGNVLFQNKGDGTFEDITEKVGLKQANTTHSQTALFFDCDNDGYLDLFVTNTAKWTSMERERGQHYFPGVADFIKMAHSEPEQNVLYHNVSDGNGGRRFVDVTAKAGVGGSGWGGDVAVFDFNRDGYLDLVVTKMFGPPQLYRNNGHGTFTDVAREVLGKASFGTIGCKVFDFNNDGLLDLFFVDMHSDMWLHRGTDPREEPREKMVKKYPKLTGPANQQYLEKKYADAFKIRYEDVVFGNTLYKHLPGDKFDEVSDQANMETFWPWGIATGDFDNDGYEDVFLPSGMGYPFYYWPNALMMNNGDGTFTDRAEINGIEPPVDGEYLPTKIKGQKASRSSRCAAVADFENNGRLNIVVNNFNDRPYFFCNHFPQKNWIAFKLEGTRSNRDAIGALVTIHCGKEVMVRQVQGAGGYLSQSSKTVHFGLGDRAGVDKVEILWPTGGARQPEVIRDPAINKIHPVKEGAASAK